MHTEKVQPLFFRTAHTFSKEEKSRVLNLAVNFNMGMLLSIEGYLEEVYPITSNYSYLTCYRAQKKDRTKRDSLRPLKVLQKKE